MGTTLTGTTPQDTYDSLIKVTDNGPLSGSLKVLTDGLGNNSTLSLSTAAASIAGTLAVTGNATFDTTTLFVDAAANEVGIGTTSPSGKLHISAPSGVASLGSTALAIRDAADARYGFDFTLEGVASGDMSLVRTVLDVQSQVMTFVRSNGNVGIGTTAPAQALDVSGSIRAVGGSYDPTTSAWINAAFATKVGASPYGGGFSLIDGTAGWTQYVNGAGANLVFAQGATSGAPTTYATLTNGGYFRLSTGGIQFNNDTAAANALDDYEEGTWTPAITFGNASVGIAYTARYGRYTKIGNQVNATCYIELSSKGSSTGDARIEGLPFSSNATSNNYACPALWFQRISYGGMLKAIQGANSSVLGITQVTTSGTSTSITDTNFDNAGEIVINLTYAV